MGEPEAKRDVPPGASPISGLPPPVHTRWKPGQSGNPGGRPKGESITATLRRLIDKDPHGRPIQELLAERLLKEALSGKFPFAKELLDRLDGRPGEQMTVKTDWRTAVANMPDEDLIEIAVRHGMVDRLPAALRERAAERTENTDA